MTDVKCNGMSCNNSRIRHVPFIIKTNAGEMGCGNVGVTGAGSCSAEHDKCHRVV